MTMLLYKTQNLRFEFYKAIEIYTGCINYETIQTIKFEYIQTNHSCYILWAF